MLEVEDTGRGGKNIPGRGHRLRNGMQALADSGNENCRAALNSGEGEMGVGELVRKRSLGKGK